MHDKFQGTCILIIFTDLRYEQDGLSSWPLTTLAFSYDSDASKILLTFINFIFFNSITN